MKILLSILGSLTIAGSGATSLANITHQSTKTNHSSIIRNQNVEQKFVTNEFVEISTNNSTDKNEKLLDYGYNIQTQSEEQFNISQFLEQYLTTHPDSSLEDDLLSSLVLINQSIQINFGLLEVYKSDSELYNILTSTELVNNLNAIYNQKLLTYDADYQVFSFGDENFKIESNLSKSIWIEIHWYWFGYFKVHLNHDLTQKIKRALDTGGATIGVIMSVFDQEPTTKIVLATLAIFCILSAWLFSEYDHGKGVWIGCFLGNVGLGWGSNK